MLALLALRRGRVVPVDALVDAMWGDDPPPSAGKTVLSHVVRLRQSLAAAGDPVETAPGGYRLAIETTSTDLAQFEDLAAAGATELRLKHPRAAVGRLEAALDLWRGPALVEFKDLAFARGECVRVEERRLVALEDLADGRLGLGAAPAVVADMERVVAEQPGRERAWSLLMRALYACGRQHDALAAYQRARTVLGEEFGLEPGEELRELERRIVGQDVSLLVPANTTVLPVALRQEGKLVARTDEVEWLRLAWRQAAAGVGQVRAVLGPSGSGRTRLAAELAAEVSADGASVEYVAGTTGPVLGAGTGPGSVIDAVTLRCASGPLLVIVDDVDWTPTAGIEAVRALATAAERLPLLLLLIGADEPGPAIRLVRELERTVCMTISLAPLSDQALNELLIADGVDSETAAAAVTLASGLSGVARREAMAWAERAAMERLNAAATRSIGAQSEAASAGASVFDEVMRLVDARARRATLVGAEWSGRQPYRSLASYGPADADLFVGRERLVAELTARVLDRRLVAVVGASGSGKSSIVRAGLVPLVRSGRLPGGGAWRADVIVPGNDPLGTIDGIPRIDEPGAQLLVIDQFEEVLATSQLDAVASRLLDLMLDPALDARIVLVVRADQIGALASSRTLAEMIEDSQLLVGPPTDEELRRIVIEPALRTGCTVEPELVTTIVADVAGHDAALPLVSAAMAEVWERRDADSLQLPAYTAIGGLAAAVERLGDRALAHVGPGDWHSVRDVMLRLVDVTDDGAWTRRRVPSNDMPPEMDSAIEALLAARLVVHTGDTLDIVHEVVFRAWPQMVEWLEEARADITLERDLRGAARSWDVERRSDDNVLRGSRLQAATEWAARCDHVPAVVTDLIAASHEWAERDNRAIREQLAREQRGRRRLRTALVAASLLVVIAVVVGLLALDNSRRADRQRDRADAAAIEAAQAADEADAAAVDAAEAADLAEQRRSDAESARSEAEAARAEAVAQGNISAQAALVNDAVVLREDRRDLAALLAVEAHRRSPSVATENALFGLFTQSPGVERTLDFADGDLRDNVTLLPDGATIAAASDTGAVRLIDAATGRDVATLRTGATHPLRGWSEHFAASPDSRLLAVSISRGVQLPDGSDGGPSTNISVWNVETREPVFSGVEVPGLIGSLALSTDGRLLAASGGEEGQTVILDATSGTVLREIEPIPRPDDARYFTNTVAVAFMSDDRLIVTSQAGPIRIIDPRSGAEMQRIEGPRETAEAAAILAPDESWLLTNGYSGLMRYDLPSGRPAWDAPSNHECQATAVTPIGLALCVELGGRITTIDLASGGLGRASFEGTPGTVNTAATRDGSIVIVFGAGRYTLWRTDGSGLVNTVLARSDTPFLAGYTNDGARVLLETEDDDGPAVEIVDASSGAVVDRVPGATMVHPTRVPERVVMRFADGRIGWYDLAAHGPAGTAVDPGLDPVDIVETPAGALAWDFAGRFAAIDLQRGFVVDLPSIKGPLWRVAIDREGRLYTTTFHGAGELQRRDPATLVELANADAVGPSSGLAVTADEIVMTSDTGDNYLLDPDTLQVAGKLPLSRSGFSDLAVSGDGNRLITIGGDDEIRLYDVATRLQIGVELPYMTHGPTNNLVQHGLALRPDGRQAAFVAPGGIAIWDLDPNHWVDAACQLASRNLTREEWATYVGDLADYHATCPDLPVG